MKFGKSPVSSFWVFLKKKLTNAHTHAHTWLSLYKSIINRIIKEICIHKFNLPKFWCSNSMHFSYELTQNTKGKYDWLIEWCFTPLLTVFQSYHGDSSHYSCLSWVSPVLGWALKCLAQGHSHEKTRRIQCGSNLRPLDNESNTLPLSHVGPPKGSNSYCF